MKFHYFSKDSASALFVAVTSLILVISPLLCHCRQGRNRVHVITNHIQNENNLNEEFTNFVDFGEEGFGALQEGSSTPGPGQMVPIVVNTWGFVAAAENAWTILENGGTALDAVERGCTACEELQCDGTVGFGGSPDENGETTLDAMIMDGETHAVGAVACLRRIKPAISVARKVLEHTQHTILAGELATAFAVKMGFKEESLSTPASVQMHEAWKNSSCQPNFWKNVSPDPTQSCGPYTISEVRDTAESARTVDRFNHDTVSMVAIDLNGRIASGTSSNGARNKVPGRVGDAPIVGAGSYVDREVGGAAATGDGDIMMRFLPSFVAVEGMRRGLSPVEAATEAVGRIAKFYPNFSGALIAVNLQGEYGAACHGLPAGFPYSVRTPGMDQVTVNTVQCS